MVSQRKAGDAAAALPRVRPLKGTGAPISQRQKGEAQPRRKQIRADGVDAVL